MKLLLGIVVSIFSSAVSSAADDLPKSYQACGIFRVAEVISGDHLILSDGSTLKLDLVMTPQTVLEGRSWPYAAHVKDSVTSLLNGQEVTLFCTGEERNRHDDRKAVVRLSDGGWLYEEILSRGLGWVEMTGDDMALASDLYVMEDSARVGGLGIWANDNYRVRDAKNVDGITTGFYHVIRGTVTTSSKGKSVTYINFGSNYRSDFTLEAAPRVHTAFKKAGIDLEAISGKAVEVRGWVDWAGGPRITLTDPVQLRILP